MTAHPFLETWRNRALFILLLLAAQAVTAQDNSQKVAPVIPGAMMNTNETANPQVGTDGRTVTGKVVLTDTNAPTDLNQAQATFHSGVTFKMLDQLQQAKTLDERLAFFQSDEYQKAIANSREYAVKLSAGRSFALAGVVPGNYELDVQLVETNATTHMISTNVFTSPQEILVPKTTNVNGDVPLDLGTIELKKLALPALPAEAVPK